MNPTNPAVNYFPELWQDHANFVPLWQGAATLSAPFDKTQ